MAENEKLIQASQRTALKASLYLPALQNFAQKTIKFHCKLVEFAKAEGKYDQNVFWKSWRIFLAHTGGKN